MDLVVGLDGAMVELLESQYAHGGHPRFAVVPNWERLALFPDDGAVAPWTGYDALAAGDRTVVLSNALGSGFLESPALQGFLPGIAERLLGAPLGSRAVEPRVGLGRLGARRRWR